MEINQIGFSDDVYKMISELVNHNQSKIDKLSKMFCNIVIKLPKENDSMDVYTIALKFMDPVSVTRNFEKGIAAIMTCEEASVLDKFPTINSEGVIGINGKN